MASNFITNNSTKGKSLRNRLIELISGSNEMRFLVGFFYFSGISELYESLKKKDSDFVLKILVGLEIDKTMSEMCVEIDNQEHNTKRDIENGFFSSVRKSISSDDFDTKEFFEQISFFVDLIINDRIVIRKTKVPNHAKLYLFNLEENPVLDKMFITGSSNLTKPGLLLQNEFNVEVKDYGADDAGEYFDDLWNDSVKITEIPDLKQRLIDTIQKKTPVKVITPFEAFVLVLKTYIDSRASDKDLSMSLKDKLEKSGYILYKYQEDAVKQSLSILRTYNGVIVADVVGLGKSVIASMIATELKERGIVLCPPGLIPAWKQYLTDFGLSNWEVMSSGNLRAVKEFSGKQIIDPLKVVILDEAHRFRNSDTDNYEILKNLCRDKKTVLLSATPFNNSPADILSLLELFTIPKKSLITLDGNLKNIFKIFKSEFDKLAEINKYYNHSDADKILKAKASYSKLFGNEDVDINIVRSYTKDLAIRIRSVIEPVTVRRNRLDLQNHPDYKEEVSNLSKIEPPKTWFYELTKEQSDFYDLILNDYFSEEGEFTGAIYKPFVYETGKILGEDLDLEENRQYQSQKNTAIFIKRLLVKRLESSFGSFEKSIDNFIDITEKILSFINKNKKYILDRKLINKISELDEEEVEGALKEFAKKLEEGDFPKSNKIYKLKNFVNAEGFIKDIESDLEVYRKIKRKLIDLNMVKNDPKSKAIIKKIKESLTKKPKKDEPERKIIIFTEYRDTANFLAPILEKEFGNNVLFSGDLGANKIKEINNNFDASVDESKQADSYDILLATDKISEGFNLNRAGMIINYDIPWNPVRVIQRVGRINRISKKVFEKLFIVNFFPSEMGSDLVQTEKIAANKMFMIHNVLGEDAMIFHTDEEPTPAALFDKMKQDPDDEEESIETKIANKYKDILENYPELIEEMENYPSKIKVSKEYDNKALLVFTRRKRMHIQQVWEDKDRVNVDEVPLESVYDDIYCEDLGLKSLKLSENFWNFYTKSKDHKAREFATGSQQSIEVKTNNFLNFIIAENKNDGLLMMAEILLEDMNDYGTLALPTMRKIISFEKKSNKERKRGLEEIVADLGGLDYLDKIKKKISDTRKEIVIAIENQ